MTSILFLFQVLLLKLIFFISSFDIRLLDLQLRGFFRFSLNEVIPISYLESQVSRVNLSNSWFFIHFFFNFTFHCFIQFFKGLFKLTWVNFFYPINVFFNSSFSVWFAGNCASIVFPLHEVFLFSFNLFFFYQIKLLKSFHNISNSLVFLLVIVVFFYYCCWLFYNYIIKLIKPIRIMI